MARPSHKPAALAVENIVIPQGADWALAWYFTEDGALPADWPSGWTGRAAALTAYGGTRLASFHSGAIPVGGGGVVLETVVVDTVNTARITLTLDDAASTAMTWQDTTGVYQVELRHTSDGRVVRLVEGTATLSAEADTDA